MARMTGGEALVQSLYREGVRVIFGLPGVQLYGVMAALRDEPRIRFIATRHEQATSFMADGYARAGGDFGTAFVVPGPGLLNAASGLSTAYSASAAFSAAYLTFNKSVPSGRCGPCFSIIPMGRMHVPLACSIACRKSSDVSSSQCTESLACGHPRLAQNTTTASTV